MEARRAATGVRVPRARVKPAGMTPAAAPWKRPRTRACPPATRGNGSADPPTTRGNGSADPPNPQPSTTTDAQSRDANVPRSSRPTATRPALTIRAVAGATARLRRWRKEHRGEHAPQQRAPRAVAPPERLYVAERPAGVHHGGLAAPPSLHVKSTGGGVGGEKEEGQAGMTMVAWLHHPACM
eukprot:333693-Chlamydomonas_euryale.AAC.1